MFQRQKYNKITSHHWEQTWVSRHKIQSCVAVWPTEGATVHTCVMIQQGRSFLSQPPPHWSMAMIHETLRYVVLKMTFKALTCTYPFTFRLSLVPVLLGRLWRSEEGKCNRWQNYFYTWLFADIRMQQMQKQETAPIPHTIHSID